ncbi:hypothetical protein AR457_02710 [Streptomyces agglomeratus]|uniref:hypothetical protein n=1 Tax=Streptomyces agglomeratus TaxID=285458 RepID=UPI0008547FA8|nr:hypothetical protein [Streptomyces agglomeratus]OEJ43165.1 hypothetical protein AR457_02710 [Streptomyces agglomeratus]
MAYAARRTAGLDTAYGRNLAIGFVDITGLNGVDTNGYRVVVPKELKTSDPALYKSLGLARRPQIERFVIVPTFNNPSTSEADGAHSEMVFFTQELLFMGVADRSRTFLLYSDLSPCDGCAPEIPENTEVRWMTKSGKGSFQRRERILNAAAAASHEAQMTDADRERNQKAVLRTRQMVLDKRAREAERLAQTFGKVTPKKCATQAPPSTLPGNESAGVHAQSASLALPRARSVAYLAAPAAPCAEEDTKGAGRGGLPRALAGPMAEASGGIDFSSLELRYLSDPGDGSGLQYSFEAPAVAGGDHRPRTGLTAADQASDAFFVWLSLHPSSFWVNLKPNEPDRIVDSRLGRTDAGRIMLQADLRMKKTVAKLIHPDAATGREFWNRVSGACMSFRTWILSAPASVHKNGDKLYILDAPLDVKMETQYQQKTGASKAASCPQQDKAAEDRNERLFRSLILPKLKHSINTAPEYAELRRVYLARVAAEWYRELSRTKPTTYRDLVDKGDITPWQTESDWKPTDTFDQYVRSHTKGEFKVSKRTTSGNKIYVRTYSYGGVDLTRIPLRKVSDDRFAAQHAGLAKDIDQSLNAPRPASGGTVLLGAPTPRQAAGLGPSEEPTSPAALALRLLPVLLLPLAALLWWRRRRLSDSASASPLRRAAASSTRTSNTFRRPS